MASDRIIVKQRRNVFITHVCSKCGFPVITAATIIAEAQKTYSFSQSKAEQIAHSTALDAIKSEIQRIEACETSKTFLEGKLNQSSMIVPGHFCDSEIIGIAEACPLCANLEPWQVKDSTPVRMNKLASENFPKVFTDSKKADLWAKECVLQMVDNIHEQQASEDECRKAQITAIRLFRHIEELEEQRKNIPELQKKADCQKIKDEIEKQRKLVGLLDFKRKKLYSAQLKDIDAKLSEVTRVVDKKNLELMLNILSDRADLIKLKAVGFGCSREVYSINFSKSFVYFMKTEDIPNEMLSSIDSSSMELNEKSEIQVNPGDVHSKSNELYIPRFCRKCGFELVPDSAFCSKCGNRIDG